MNAMTNFPAMIVQHLDLADGPACGRVDQWVRKQPGATPFHLTGWSRAVQRGCGQQARYLVAEALDGTIMGVLPLTEVRSPLFGNALASAGFAVGGGLLLSDLSAQGSLLDAAIALARKLDCPTLELRGGALPHDWHIDETTYLGFARDLAMDDEAELLAIPRKQRAEVRKALGYGLEISIGRDASALAGHYAVYAESVRNLGTPVFPRELFSAVIDEFGPEADILTVSRDGRPLASVLSLYFNGTVMPYWGGGTVEARAARANDLMYFALMNHARNIQGCTRFDFGRSKAGTGPAAFKKNWGFEGRQLCYAKLALDGSAPRDINPMSARYRLQVSLWQKLPLAIANRIGPWIARGLG